MKQKFSLVIFGIVSALFLSQTEPVLFQLMLNINSLLAYHISLLVIIPIIEEIVKYYFIMTPGFGIKLRKEGKERELFFNSLLFGYVFQLTEMVINANSPYFWFRLFLPIHIYFCVVATRQIKHSLVLAIVLHFIWNLQISFPILLYILTFMYWVHLFYMIFDYYDLKQKMPAVT